MHVLVIAQYFPPDMGGGSARASNVVKGLLSKGCNVTVIAAFPHYPHGKVPVKYKRKPIVAEQAGGEPSLYRTPDHRCRVHGGLCGRAVLLAWRAAQAGESGDGDHSNR